MIMKKIYLVLVILLLSITASFSQIRVDVNESDSIIATYNFCLIVPERVGENVTLKCSDRKGAIIYMEIREDVFHGKINIIITPNEELGPITEESTLNWFMLPEAKDSIEIIE